MAGWVKEEVVRRGLQENFILLGRYPIDRMLSFYQHADALLVTLKSDPVFSMTLPGKVQSYLACGKPFVAALDGAAGKLATESRAAMTCPAGDAQALADAVSKMALFSRAERAEMGKRGKEYYAFHFNRQLLLGRCEGWMSELVSANAAG